MEHVPDSEFGVFVRTARRKATTDTQSANEPLQRVPMRSSRFGASRAVGSRRLKLSMCFVAKSSIPRISENVEGDVSDALSSFRSFLHCSVLMPLLDGVAPVPVLTLAGELGRRKSSWWK